MGHAGACRKVRGWLTPHVAQWAGTCSIVLASIYGILGIATNRSLASTILFAGLTVPRFPGAWQASQKPPPQKPMQVLCTESALEALPGLYSDMLALSIVTHISITLWPTYITARGQRPHLLVFCMESQDMKLEHAQSVLY